MKNTVSIFALAALFIATQATCKKNVSNECGSCEEKRFVQEFNSLSGVVSKVAEGEPYFDGRKYYLLVNAETSLQTLYGQNGNKYERLYPCSRADLYTDADTGKTVTISGKLSKCTTPKHGLLTNNVITFNIYEP